MGAAPNGRPDTHWNCVNEPRDYIALLVAVRATLAAKISVLERYFHNLLDGRKVGAVRFFVFTSLFISFFEFANELLDIFNAESGHEGILQQKWMDGGVAIKM